VDLSSRVAGADKRNLPDSLRTFMEQKTA